MGAYQSTASARSAADQSGVNVRTCYYDLLGITREATEDEIKKAYHRKALELHPDRNLGNIDATTKQFAEVQSAYEILADPQERAWYDSHRDSILRDEEGSNGDHYEHNVRITTAEDILRIFRNFNGHIDYSDEPIGFFKILNEVFQGLAHEEEVACAWEGLKFAQYPSFGSAHDNYEATVRPFYAVWVSFATQKTFAWKDAHRYADAPDRRMRRLMEKENRRLREEGVREFNDAVRSLVAFVKKRDPRVKSTKKNEAERQKSLRDAAIAQAARSRAINQANVANANVVPDWIRSSEPLEDELTDEEDMAPPVEEFECVVCGKSFKSEKQYEAHEKSKKHVKAVQQTRKDILREDAALDLDYTTDPWPTAQRVTNVPGGPIEHIPERDSLGDFAHTMTGRTPLNEDPTSGTVVSSVSSTPIQVSNSSITSASSCETPVGDDYASRERTQSQGLGGDAEGAVVSSAHEAISLDGLDRRLAALNIIEDARPKQGKAKEKRAKKAAAASAGDQLDLKCVTCQAQFSSKSKLFNHITSLRHAQPMSKAARGGKVNKQ